MRSLATDLRATVLQCLIDGQPAGWRGLTDEDFAFVEMAGQYGQQRATGASFADAVATARAADQGSLFHRDPSAGQTGLPKGPAPWAVQPKPVEDQAGPKHDAAATIEADRGPEPQTAGEVIDTAFSDSDPRDLPPDYTKLTG